MRITVGIEGVNSYFYNILTEELAEYAPVTISRDSTTGETVVQAEGSLVKCSCIVAICDKYRNSGSIGLKEEDY